MRLRLWHGLQPAVMLFPEPTCAEFNIVHTCGADDVSLVPCNCSKRGLCCGTQNIFSQAIHEYSLVIMNILERTSGV